METQENLYLCTEAFYVVLPDPCIHTWDGPQANPGEPEIFFLSMKENFHRL